ncbi:TnsA-like heteromeric transposase endonuclease subunit [Streptomyces sp. XM83C]|uniref:TnsA-like heteromeric transposase endonuclease subunit n=1 Tax=Streptomyces sp. XM83C TaxID=2929781 RepID=UPI001FF90B48|nr:TnsA-like heteromeric transposase endonuclease subunit [Streptomyces sp. XM83C]MCK1822460.1 TnsA-like heteromeric transposase endonuclease subunit [Streptomyces sp. XM83C]
MGDVRVVDVPAGPVWSHACRLDDLALPYALPERATECLDLGPGWSRTWTVTWKVGKSDVIVPVKDLSAGPAMASVPVRRFSWRTGQRHRPGLECLVTTGRQHGFESLAERWLLLVLDFVSGFDEVLAQPFRLRFSSSEGKGSHIPDFLVLAAGASWLVDVRPGGLIGEEDEVRFAATAQVAAAAGWRCMVLTGWRRQVLAGIDALSVRRRPMTDPLGLERQLLAAVGRRPWLFAELVDQTHVPAVARTHAVHLLWHRRMAVDLALPFGDETWVYPVGGRDG